MDVLTQALGGDTAARMGREVGADPAATSAGIAAALPVLLAGLSRNAADPAGAQALHGALAKDHDGSILDNLGGFLGNAQARPGAGILSHVLGDRQDSAVQAVGKVSGLDKGQVMALLVTLAPVVLGALGRAQRQRNLDPNGLASMLGAEHAQQTQAAPDLMGMATKLFDRNADGSIMDDLMRGVGGLLGKK
jgi:hypothetical protein